MIQPLKPEPPLSSVPIWPNPTHNLPWLLALNNPFLFFYSRFIFILCFLKSYESIEWLNWSNQQLSFEERHRRGRSHIFSDFTSLMLPVGKPCEGHVTHFVLHIFLQIGPKNFLYSHIHSYIFVIIQDVLTSFIKPQQSWAHFVLYMIQKKKTLALPG